MHIGVTLCCGNCGEIQVDCQLLVVGVYVGGMGYLVYLVCASPTWYSKGHTLQTATQGDENILYFVTHCIGY